MAQRLTRGGFLCVSTAVMLHSDVVYPLAGVMCVLGGCPVLQLLDLTGCLFVSNSSVSAAVSRMKEDQSRTLHLVVGGIYRFMCDNCKKCIMQVFLASNFVIIWLNLKCCGVKVKISVVCRKGSKTAITCLHFVFCIFRDFSGVFNCAYWPGQSEDILLQPGWSGWHDRRLWWENFIFQRAESVYQAVTWRFLKDIFLNAYIIVLS